MIAISRTKILILATAWSGVTLAAFLGGAWSQTADLADLRGRALDLVNAERRERKLPELRFEDALNEAALQHARDMLSRNYYSHRSPEGETVQDRFIAAGGGKWRLVSENIAKCENCDPPVDAGHVEQLHKGWMESPEHRRNILTEGLDRFGYGIVADQAGGLYAVQTFSGPGAARGLASGEAAAPIEPGEQQRIALEMINEQRSKVDAPPLQPGEALSGVLDAVHESGLEPQASGDLFSHVQSEQRRDWRTLQVMYAQCGGCGVTATAADVRYFVSEMLEDSARRSVLLDPKFTHLAFSVKADGEGRKDAAMVLGASR